ncbi:type II secretion system protein [Clostridium sp. ATCC 25772]|uniref:type II secretion system protein n=1 Tax=Clostridium sp. ATCC 25772 TaxID=1676991 RepID=UPI00078388E6|nr:type II secretion system protein [Clostridium sp. ATCC 25772]
MSILKNKKGFMMLELVIAMSIILIAVTLILQSMVVNRSIANKLEKDKKFHKSVDTIEKIIVYNTSIDELEKISNKEIYITFDDLEKYHGEKIGSIISDKGDIKISFTEDNGFVKAKIIGIGEYEKNKEYTFVKGIYEK